MSHSKVARVTAAEIRSHIAATTDIAGVIGNTVTILNRPGTDIQIGCRYSTDGYLEAIRISLLGGECQAEQIAALLNNSAPDMAAEIARLKEINAELIHALEEVRGFMGDVCAPEYYWNLVNPAIAKAEQL